MNGKIHLKNMVFFGYHGHNPAEQDLGQRFEVDLTLAVNMADAARTDDLSMTVDYLKVFETCREVIEQDRFALLEALADDLAGRILQHFSRVDQVELTIKKPSVALRGAIDYVAIEITKARA